MSSTDKKPSTRRRISLSNPGRAEEPRRASAATHSRSRGAEDAKHPTHDDIARRAYEIFVSNGRQEGHELENWLQAEHELIHRV